MPGVKREVGPLALWAYKHAPTGFPPRYVAGITLQRRGQRRRRLKVMVE